MNEIFYKWLNENQVRLGKKGIQTQNISKSPQNPNPSVFTDHYYVNKLGRITVWKSGIIDMEILDEQSEETVFHKHFEITDKSPNVENVLEEYFRNLMR